ncbi:MAG: hypothetical protein IV106_07500 [Pseudomonas umsongensis]|nr:hypothetical protein [Pseudomonas umsongensis]
MKNSIQIDYQNKTIVFSSSGWLNASHVAELYSASVDGWLRSRETQVRIPRHPATQSTNIRPPVPRSSGQAVGAQRRRFALLV